MNYLPIAITQTCEPICATKSYYEFVYSSAMAAKHDPEEMIRFELKSRPYQTQTNTEHIQERFDPFVWIK